MDNQRPLRPNVLPAFTERKLYLPMQVVLLSPEQCFSFFLSGPGSDQLRGKMCRNNKVYSSSRKTDETGKILACSSVGGG